MSHNQRFTPGSRLIGSGEASHPSKNQQGFFSRSIKNRFIPYPAFSVRPMRLSISPLGLSGQAEWPASQYSQYVSTIRWPSMSDERTEIKTNHISTIIRA
jgi:hypothetical protein